MPIKYTKKRAQQLLIIRRALSKCLLQMLKEDYPEGTKARCEWIHRDHKNKPESIWIIINYDVFPQSAGYSGIPMLSDLEDNFVTTYYIPLKRLDSLGRPNGDVELVSPKQFDNDFTIIKG